MGVWQRNGVLKFNLLNVIIWTATETEQNEHLTDKCPRKGRMYRLCVIAVSNDVRWHGFISVPSTQRFVGGKVTIRRHTVNRITGELLANLHYSSHSNLEANSSTVFFIKWKWMHKTQRKELRWLPDCSPLYYVSSGKETSLKWKSNLSRDYYPCRENPNW